MHEPRTLDLTQQQARLAYAAAEAMRASLFSRRIACQVSKDPDAPALVEQLDAAYRQGQIDALSGAKVCYQLEFERDLTRSWKRLDSCRVQNPNKPPGY